MHKDHGSVGALSQWFPGHCGKARVDRAVIPAASRKQVTERLESVEARLPETLPLDHDPVVVPVGQQVPGSHERLDLFIGPVIHALRQAMRDRGRTVEVHLHAPRKREMIRGCVDDCARQLSESPQRSAEIGIGGGLAVVGPKRSGHEHPSERAPLKSQKGHKPLRRGWQRHEFALVAKLKATQQGDLCDTT